MNHPSRIKIPDINTKNIPGKLVFCVLTGKHSKGIADKKEVLGEITGVYVPSDENKSAGLYKEKLKIDHNYNVYEFTYFIQELKKGNTDFIEMLFSKRINILYATAYFMQEIYMQRLTFITKRFGFNTISTASKLLRNAKINSKTMEKVVDDGNAVDIRDYLTIRTFSKFNHTPSLNSPMTWKENKRRIENELMKVKQLAVKEVKGMTNVYDLYFDITGKRFGNGIVQNNAIVQFKVPEGRFKERPVGIMYFDERSFSRDTLKKESSFWQNNSMEATWIQDSKYKEVYYNSTDMMNAIRYLDIVLGFFKEKDSEINVIKNAEFYKSIINGKHEFSSIFKMAQCKLKELRVAIKESNMQLQINDSLLRQMASRVSKDARTELSKNRTYKLST